MSGHGSGSIQTSVIRLELPKLFSEHKIKSILDVPCGDFFWMKDVEKAGASYIGADVVEEMIEYNNIAFASEAIKFIAIDITEDVLPQVDLILCRDLFVHLSFDQIGSALANIIQSGSKYLCMTHFSNRRQNSDIHTGGWRPLNFIQQPFLFPTPLQVINEQCTEEEDQFSDKCLALWKISDLDSCLYFSEYKLPSQSCSLRNVFTYWEGEQPSLVELLIELMRLHSKDAAHYNFKCLSKDQFLSEYDDVPDCFDSLSYAHQADVVRVWALMRHGGIWLDSDTLVMNSLSSLFEKAFDKKAGFFVTQNNQNLCNGVFGSKSSTDLLAAWKKHIQNHLLIHGPNIEWEAIGNQFLAETFVAKPELFNDYIIFDGLSTMYPVNWDKCVDLFLDEPYSTWKNLAREYQPLIVLVNSVYKALGSHSKEQLLESEYPLNYFIGKSLKQLLL